MKKKLPEGMYTVQDLYDELADLISQGYSGATIALQIGDIEHSELELFSVRRFSFGGKHTIFLRF